MFLRDDAAEQAELLHPLDDLFRILVVVLQPHRHGVDVALEEAVHRVEDQALALVHGGVHAPALWSRFGTSAERSKERNTVPSALKPSVRVVTMPWPGRDRLSRTSSTSERA